VLKKNRLQSRVGAISPLPWGEKGMKYLSAGEKLPGVFILRCKS